MAERKPHDDSVQSLAALKSMRAPEIADPILDAAEDGRRAGARAIAARDYAAAVESRQGAFLSASGTLTQFNAIMAALQGAVLSSAGTGLLRSAIAGGLLLHVLAAFLLCWAARPIEEKPSTVRGMALVDNYRQADDTFRNYRRGWRMTLLALSVSAIGLGLFLLQTFGRRHWVA